MKFFDNPIYTTYNIAGLSVVTASVGAQFTGPHGARGRIVSANCIIVTALGVADALVRVGTSADPDKNLSMTVPQTGNVGDLIIAPKNLMDKTYIDPDALLQIDTDGGATATGGVDVSVTVAWENLP